MRPEGWCQWKIPMTPSGNPTRDLPACNAVSQPDASPRAPTILRPDPYYTLSGQQRLWSVAESTTHLSVTADKKGKM